MCLKYHPNESVNEWESDKDHKHELGIIFTPTSDFAIFVVIKKHQRSNFKTKT